MKQKYVRLTKLKPVENPLIPTPLAEDYVSGQDNGAVSLPIDYWVTGTLHEDPQVGLPIRVRRDCRNGEWIDGTLTTSPVQRIDGDMIYTANSVYKLEEVIK